MNFKKIVVKIGTSTIADSDRGLPNLTKMKNIVDVLMEFKQGGSEIVVVSSGAIGLGAGKLGLLNCKKTIEQKQACASIGQCFLMNLYGELFSKFGVVVSQILLTQQVLDKGENEKNSINTFKVLFKYGVVPIVNANDTISTKELEFGDNDSLSAAVASLIEADLLIILTDMDGLFDKNPKINSDAKLIRRIDNINEKIKNMAGATSSVLGTGGMASKIKAAEFLSDWKIPVVIINGAHPERMLQIASSGFIGTIVDTENTLKELV